MNKSIGKIGSIIVSVTVLLFAAAMPFSAFASYLLCMILPIGYIMMAAGFSSESDESRRTAAKVGLIFAAIYAALIFIVYFAQTTVVARGSLGTELGYILDFSKGGLLFNYDLLGYGMMALSTFFIGLTVSPKNKADKWLKALLMLHGIFFFGCFIMPMTGAFASMASGEGGMGGVIALEFWCAYFLPIGILSAIHFGRK